MSERHGAPQVPRAFVRRQRLTDLLDEATTHPLTVVVAPAGTGKTALLADWSRTAERPIVWVDGVTADLRALGTALVSGAAAKQRAPTRSGAEVVAALRRRSDPPGVLVIDDAHRLGPDMWDLIETVLTDVPDRVRLVLSSRRDTPFGLVALQLTDAVTVLRADKLSFAQHEAAAVIKTHAVDATTEEVESLRGRANGWAAALVLGARMLAGAPDRDDARVDLDVSQQPILDYLLGEVFTTLPAAARHVLLCTCQEDDLDGHAAFILTGDPAAPDRLAELAADGFLVTQYRPLTEGHSPRWRYHPLLRELLRRQVAHRGPNRKLAMAAHERAARHYAVHGPAAESVRHAAHSGNAKLLTELLVEHAPALVIGGHDAVLADALGMVPADVLRTDPALLAPRAFERLASADFEGTALVTGRVQKFSEDRRLALLDQGLPLAGADAALRGDAVLLGLATARRGAASLTEVIDDARALIGCRPGQHRQRTSVSHDEHHPRWPISVPRTGWILQQLAMAELWAGDLAAAHVHAADAVRVADALGHQWLLADSLSSQAVLELIEGRFDGARKAAEAAVDIARAGFVGERHVSMARLVLGHVAWAGLDLPSAESELDAVDRGSAALADHLHATLADLLRARVRVDSGDLTGARTVLREMDAPSAALPGVLTWLVAYESAQCALMAGDLADVRSSVEVMKVAGTSPGGELLFEAMLADRADDPGTGDRLIAELLSLPPLTRRNFCESSAMAFRTRRLLLVGDRAGARVSFRDTLTTVSPQRIVRPLLDASFPVTPLWTLLLDELARPQPHPFAAEAYTAVAAHLRHGGDARNLLVRPDGPRVRPSDSVDDPTVQITKREADVLEQLALGGSYAEIAQSLYITENTVKTHLGALYRKLGVDRRSAALRRARETGLLSTPSPMR